MGEGFATDVRKLLLQVTPEKGEELEALTSGVTFREVTEGETIDFKAISEWKLVSVPMRCQLRLWIHAFAYYAAFEAFEAKRNGQNCQSGYSISAADLDVAGSLLEWAVETDVGVMQIGDLFSLPELPPNVPLPFDGQSPSPLKKAAHEIFLNALAFILHHELAHVHLAHPGNDVECAVAQDNEYKADAAAAEWLLGNDSLREFDYLLRHIGVATALLWFMSINFRVEDAKRTHPPTWRRLIRALEPTVRAEVDAVWGFVATSLSLHFHRHGLSLDCLSQFGPTLTTVNKMVGVIEQHNEKLGIE